MSYSLFKMICTKWFKLIDYDRHLAVLMKAQGVQNIL